MALNKEKVMDAARKFVDKGQIDKAVKEYLRIVHEDPKDVRVWLKIGDLYAKKGSKPEATEAYLKVARFYHEQGFFLKAVAAYKQVLKLDPRLVAVIQRLAELYQQLGLISDAVQHYESVAAHYHRDGNTKQALDAVKKLVELDPENIATRIKLAELYSKEQFVEDASVQFAYACDQLRKQDRQEDFLKVAERLLWHKPDNLPLNRELAGLYLRRNDPRRALQKLQVCYKADKRDVETLGLLALAFQALDQKAKTVSVLKELARIHLENKARDAAADAYRKILEIVPHDQDALQFLGAQPQPVRTTGVRPATTVPVRPATDPRFGITDDLPLTPLPIVTGSMPLVDDQSFSANDFALPEYDDADLQTHAEPTASLRYVSAAAELHAEEIAKILAETDVYLKYGLHHKAVEHLQRVFKLDADNIEARTRLKDIYISQGREKEAQGELLRLAEVAASVDPNAAEHYLQELLAIDGTHQDAIALARRFRLSVARMSSAAAEDDYGSGTSESPRPSATGRRSTADDGGRGWSNDRSSSTVPLKTSGRTRPAHDSIDDFDPNDLIGGVAHGSPAPAPPPQRPEFLANTPAAWSKTGKTVADDTARNSRPTFDLDDKPAREFAGDTRTERRPLRTAGLSRPMNPSENGFSTRQPAKSVTRDNAGVLDRPLQSRTIATNLDPSDDIDAGEDLPFDRDAARAFDAGMATRAQPVEKYDNNRSPRPAAVETSYNGSYDPYSPDHYGEATSTNAEMSANPGLAHRLVEEEVEEAEFYAGQEMYAEAIDSLRASLKRYPDHPLILAKLADVQAMDSTQAGAHALAAPAATPSVPVQFATELQTGATDALDTDDIEELSDGELEEVESKPSVLLEQPVEESDADTHYDLGLAYKEMGLYGEAIKAFTKVLRAQTRDAQCRVMMGLCQREQGNTQEAIHEFKQGLHSNPTERERLSLYYELGVSYDTIGDGGEALYYLEAVVKRDPQFADTAARIQTLRLKGGTPTPFHDDD